MGKGLRKGCNLHFSQCWSSDEEKTANAECTFSRARHQSPRWLGASKGLWTPHRVWAGGSGNFSRFWGAGDSAATKNKCKSPQLVSLPLNSPWMIPLFLLPDYSSWNAIAVIALPCAPTHMTSCLLNQIKFLKPGLSHHCPWAFCLGQTFLQWLMHVGYTQLSLTDHLPPECHLANPPGVQWKPFRSSFLLFSLLNIFLKITSGWN